jgi:hypothetical protein
LVDFQEWRDQRDWTPRKYAMWEAAADQHHALLPCGESFDSHRLEGSLIHVPHLRAAKEMRRAEPLH